MMPSLAALCPPSTIIHKTRYSAFAEPRLIEHLRRREADALIVLGSETDSLCAGNGAGRGRYRLSGHRRARLDMQLV
jgi:Isochorismatase family